MEQDDFRKNKKLTEAFNKRATFQSLENVVDGVLDQAKQTGVFIESMIEWPPNRKTSRIKIPGNNLLSAKRSDKGWGLVANQKIERGSVLLLEKDLVKVFIISDRFIQGIHDEQLAKKVRLLFPLESFQDMDEYKKTESMLKEQGLPYELILGYKCTEKLRHFGKSVQDKMKQWHEKLMQTTREDRNAAKKDERVQAFARSKRMEVFQAAALLRTIRQTMFGLETGANLRDCGAGLFPATALINHSCLPNASRMQYADKMVLYALENIDKDQEVTINYCGQTLSVLSSPCFFKERREIIQSANGFLCECDACMEAQQAFGAVDPRKERSAFSENHTERKYIVISNLFKTANLTDLEKFNHMGSYVFGNGAVQEDGIAKAMEELQNNPKTILRTTLWRWFKFGYDAVFKLGVKDQSVACEIFTKILRAVPVFIELFLPGFASQQDKTAFLRDGAKGQSIDVAFRFLTYLVCSVRRLNEPSIHQQLFRVISQYVEVFDLSTMPVDFYAIYLAQAEII